MTSSPPNSKPGSTSSTPGPTDGKSTQTTTSRTDRRGLHGNRAYTPEELEETKREMLKVSYADIEREFQKCAESKAPRSRRMQ